MADDLTKYLEEQLIGIEPFGGNDDGVAGALSAQLEKLKVSQRSRERKFYA